MDVKPSHIKVDFPFLVSLPHPTHPFFIFRPGDMITLLEDSNEDWWKVGISVFKKK